ncbi:MAG TPA: N,N-dimethylformamidase beta subunit family domain-containing protein [Isosphaeraceae bacterium]|nr:N,N-dimethylformamidase beta subunit family domain-containing protein [Isosphaeraceae bacterium]
MNLLRRDLLALLVSSLGLPSIARAWTRTTPPDRDLIRRENEREGTTEWQLDRIQPVESGPDSAYRRRPAIEGFCSRTSVRPGERLSIFISTDPPARYQVDFYRMGYYGGKGGRQVHTIGPRDGQVQKTPSDGSKNLIECRWEPSFDLEIPRDWLSGVYLGKLSNLDSGDQAYVVFLVRDDRPADLIFQCSDLTWQAYNRWPGWRSLYDWEGNRWHTSVGADVGFDRPYSVYYNGLPSGFNPLTNGSGEFLLWEHPLSFWLEREGYDVTYISNLDTHTDPDGLLRAKGFLSVGHDEYWTQAMFDNVRRARDAGVNLAFLSGNSVYHRINLRPAGDGQPHRVFGRIDQFPDEKELIGATSYGVGLGDWVCRKPSHWLFEGSGMKEGDRISQLVGWEYHGYPLREGGDLEVLATGETNQTNDPPYAATIYSAERGNFVFNAATCWWSMLLSRPPGAQNPPNKDFRKPDPRVEQITRNLLNRMIASPPATR